MGNKIKLPNDDLNSIQGAGSSSINIGDPSLNEANIGSNDNMLELGNVNLGGSPITSVIVGSTKPKGPGGIAKKPLRR